MEREYVERAARVLLQGNSGREANPVVIDAVATIMERIADHACALEFGASGAQRVAAAEALERVQALLVKLGEPRRAQFVELVTDHARRLQSPRTRRDPEQQLAISRAFITSATRFDHAFRRLDATYVRDELVRLRPAGAKQGAQSIDAPRIAGVMSAKIGAFNDRSPAKAASAFDKAWKTHRSSR